MFVCLIHSKTTTRPLRPARQCTVFVWSAVITVCYDGKLGISIHRIPCLKGHLIRHRNVFCFRLPNSTVFLFSLYNQHCWCQESRIPLCWIRSGASDAFWTNRVVQISFKNHVEGIHTTVNVYFYVRVWIFTMQYILANIYQRRQLDLCFHVHLWILMISL